MNIELREKLETIIDMAKAQGADSADAILNTGASFSLSAQKGEISKYNLSGSSVIGIRTIKDNKVGLSYTESLENDSLEFAAKMAIENALNTDEDVHQMITVKSDADLISNSKFVKEETSIQDKIDFCLKLESEVQKKDSRVQSVPYNGLSEGESATYYLNSLGTFGFDNEYYMNCYTSALINKENENSMHYHSSMGRKIADLNLEECVNESLLHASNWLGAGPVKTGTYDIIFTEESFQTVFGSFGNIFSSKGAIEKTNPFAQKIGKKIAIDEFSVMDCPFYKDSFFKYEFDSEGTKRRDLSLIQNGVLNSFYHNTATANYFKTETTGHASRGPKSAMGTGGTTKIVLAGKTSDSTITNGEYLEIHSLQGVHSGANAISGDFSFGASGYLCKDGIRVQPVKGITVAGNFHDMLLNIKAIGDKIYSTGDKGFFSPRVRFNKVSIAGL
jgi:PmbA protein